MKCQKCGNNNAVYHYTSNVNGVVTEQHLCADCAREEGLMQGDSFFDFGRDSIFGNMFAGMHSMLDSFFGGSSLLPRSFTYSMPVLMPSVHVTVDGAPKEEHAEKIPEDAGPEIKKRRELAQLKAQLEKAVQEEAFEKAAELRDQIHALEKEAE